MRGHNGLKCKCCNTNCITLDKSNVCICFVNCTFMTNVAQVENVLIVIIGFDPQLCNSKFIHKAVFLDINFALMFSLCTLLTLAN